MKGTLIYDNTTERLAIQDRDNIQHLHCGDVLEVLRENSSETPEPVWISTRVEFSSDWYLVGMYKPDEIPCDLTVRKA